MEKWCILPDNLLKEISREDNVVLHNLARFCDCKKDELIKILTTRNKYNENPASYFAYGYRKRLQKTATKTRVIHEPEENLKKIQKIINMRLWQIPVSLASMAGKIWDNVEKNTEIHRYNQYLINLDIKNSYPSINTHRVYKNLQWVLSKWLKLWCPLLESEEDKDLFIRAITHLCVCENQLPQWAPTSTQIQNIVMAWFDTKIEKKLPEFPSSNIAYTRYADDITVSFKHFSTMEVLKEKMEFYLKNLQRKEPGLHPPSNEELASLIEQFAGDTFILTDNLDLQYLQDQIEKIKIILKNTRFLPYEDLYKYIGIIDAYKKNIKYSNRRITQISDELINVIGEEGRKINRLKTHTRTPQSNTEREINGLSFDKDGNRWICKKRRSQYMRLFKDLAKLSKKELGNKLSFYSFKLETHASDEVCKAKINNVIDGIYNYILRIYGHERFPKYLKEGYIEAKKKRPLIKNEKQETKNNIEKFKDEIEQKDDNPLF